jgi:hypothetical protein
LNKISEWISKYYLEVYEHSITNLYIIPWWAHHTQQVVGDLVGEPINSRRTRYQFEGILHTLIASEPLLPMNFYMVLLSNPHSYAKVVGNHYWEVSMNEDYNSLIENQS